MHSKQDSDIIQAEICKLLSKGVLTPTEGEDYDFVSNIFTRKKRNDTYRMILNLKKFNDFLLVPHCKLGSTEDALNLITEGCYFASVDLKDAYYSIPIHKDFQKYLKMYWENYYFKYTVLPNGFAPAVREFTKVMSPPFKHLRSKGHLSVKYLDDSLLIGETARICLNNVTDTVNLLRSLGFTIHPDKSVFVPTQKITFLGFIIDSVKMTITLTEERKEKIYDNCSSLLQSNKNITVRELAQTIGTFVAAFTAINLNQLFYRHLENSKGESLRRTYGDFDKKSFIFTEAKTELKWWKENIESSFALIKVQPVHYTIYSNASLEGWGGTDG